MGERRVLQGTVVGDKMDKTIVVAVERKKKHRLYHKIMSLTVKFKAHDEKNECNLGDLVRIEECRPLSRDKRWRLIEVLSRGDVAEIQPEAIGRELEETTQVSAKSEAEAEAEAEAGGGTAVAVAEAGDDDEASDEEAKQ